MRRILVTGAAGLIGSHLSRVLLERGDEVIGLDNLSHGTLENVSAISGHPRFTLVRGDVRDAALMDDCCGRADGIVHLAAWKIPRYGEALQTLEANGIGTWTVLKAAAARALRIVVASTSDIYGRNPALPFHEESDSVLGPTTVKRWGYAVSKIFGEHLCWAFHRERELPVSVIRYFGGYGPHERMDWMAGPQAVFITKALQNEPLPIHGTGRQRRSFTYVSDLVDGTVKVLDAERAVGEAFNIGSTTETTILELAQLIWRLVHGEASSPKLTHVSYDSFSGKYEDVQRRVPDLAKARTLLGYEAAVPLRDGLTETIEWHRHILESVPQSS